VPALAGSPDSQREFRDIEARFADLPPDLRLKLEPELESFLKRHPEDDVARLARIELGWIQVFRGRYYEAHRLADAVREGPPGGAHDLADVVLAGARRRERNVGRALELLTPLRGKIVDPTWRGLFQSELVEALVAARRYLDAMSAMLDWAEQASTIERDGVVASIELLLNTMPATALEAGIRALSPDAVRDAAASPSRIEAQKWLVGTARTRLVRVALSDRDPDLARWLVESTPPKLGRDDTREALEGLAATQAVAPSVAGRSVGVVLDTTDDTSRRRSADLVSGTSHALGLPSLTVRDDAVHLVTRDASEAAEVDQALAGLAGDGAAILIAGVTDQSALAASLFAARERIPVIVLRRPQSASTPWSFVLGEDEGAAEAALEAAIVRAAVRHPVRIGPGGFSCDPPEAAGGERFPIREWKKAGTDALVLSGDAHCASDAILEASSGGLSPLFVLGLEAAEARTTGRRVFVSAGRFPFAAHPLSAEESAWVDRWGTAPSWYEALGRDAAGLAQAVLRDFPVKRVDEPAAVEALHARARDALARVQVPLWTTPAKGFEGKDVLPRQFEAVLAAPENGGP
jgi:hypothetical protein